MFFYHKKQQQTILISFVGYILILLFKEFTNMSYHEHMTESQVRLALIDFLRGLVEFDPAKRWSPFQVIVLFTILLSYWNLTCAIYISVVDS